MSDHNGATSQHCAAMTPHGERCKRPSVIRDADLGSGGTDALLTGVRSEGRIVLVHLHAVSLARAR